MNDSELQNKTVNQPDKESIDKIKLILAGCRPGKNTWSNFMFNVQKDFADGRTVYYDCEIEKVNHG